MAPQNAQPVQSVDRVFDIIEALSSSVHGMTLSDLSIKVDLHVSTTHRLLASLVHRDYVRKDQTSGRYCLTIKMFEMGSRIVGGMNLLSIARPHLEALADYTGETVHLVLRYRDEVVYIYKEDTSNSIVQMASFVGLRNPMYCTAVGKSILSRLSEEEVRSIWSRTKTNRFTPNTIVTLSGLLKDIAEAREAGFAIDDEEHEPGVFCIASAIVDFAANPVGAISISAPAVRLDEQKISDYARQVIAHTDAISRILGGVLP